MSDSPKGLTKTHLNDKLFQEILKGIDKNATLKSWAPANSNHGSGYITDIIDKGEHENQHEKMVGLFPYEIEYSIPGGENATRRTKIMIKSKTKNMDVIQSFAKLIPDSGEEYRKIFKEYAPKMELGSVEYRELGSIGIEENGIRAIMPHIYWSILDPEKEIFAFAMEYLEPECVSHLNSMSNLSIWKDEDILAVLDGLASFHATFYNRVSDLPANLRKYIDVPYNDRLIKSYRLWEASVVRNREIDIWTPEMEEVGNKLLNNLPQICDILDKAPWTFLHNDVNVMNVCLRRNPSKGKQKLCLYDWELCYTGPPQQDIALFFCFLFPRNTKKERWQYFVTEYYNSLVKYLKQGNQYDESIPSFVDFQKVFDICMMESFINRSNWGPAVVCEAYDLEFMPRLLSNNVQYIKDVWEKYNLK